MTRCLDGYDRLERTPGQFSLAKKVEVTFSGNEVRQIGRTDAHVTRREQHSLVELRELIATTNHLDEELPLMLGGMSP